MLLRAPPHNIESKSCNGSYEWGHCAYSFSFSKFGIFLFWSRWLQRNRSVRLVARKWKLPARLLPDSDTWTARLGKHGRVPGLGILGGICCDAYLGAGGNQWKSHIAGVSLNENHAKNHSRHRMENKVCKAEWCNLVVIFQEKCGTWAFLESVEWI